MTDVAKPGLNLRMGPIAFALLLKGLVETLRLGPGLFEPRRPGTGCLIALVAWWRRITPRADIKQQPPNGAEIVRQQIAELLVQIKRTEERSVGKACVRKLISMWEPYSLKN